MTHKHAEHLIHTFHIKQEQHPEVPMSSRVWAADMFTKYIPKV